ncbi:hypothetical protein PRVXT_002103 [Proteinivorax tanatarense]|uniref:Uncharacterized protein n=1 Tax=Proteinivorax tanatarense TaxID=1260629 RepID=A0AAU7VIZ1_9FIRM
MKKLLVLAIVLLLTLSVVGCSGYSADSYETESLGSQSMEIEFEALDGAVEEMLAVDGSSGLDFEIQLEEGELEAELFLSSDEDGADSLLPTELGQVFSPNNSLEYSTEDSFTNGIYRIVLEGENASGTVLIDFN